jgi:DNA-binding PadR family transcriptional regulator
MRALLFYWRLAIHQSGYKICGVHGWAHLADVEEATRQALWEQLPSMHRRGLLDHADVRAPSRARPVWVYRISDRGVRAVHEFAEMGYQPSPMHCTPATDSVMWAPNRQRGALLLLRAAYDQSGTPVRFGERGWLTGRELGERVHEQNRTRSRAPFLAVDATDLRWLLGNQLIERRDEPAPPGRAVVYWRATELGRSVRVLEWKPIPGEG